MRRSGIAVCLSVVALGISFPGCERESASPPHDQHSREVMGTLANVTAYARDRTTAQAAVEAAYARLDDVNRLMSDYVDNSEIGRLNQCRPGQTVSLSPETFEVLQKGTEIASTSGGAFDFTCRPLVSLWKEAAKNGELPEQAAIQSTFAKIGWEKLSLDPATKAAAPTVPGLQVDLGAIAKGYALDLAIEAMQKGGATAGLVDVGGDVRVFGRRDGDKLWHIGVRHPFQKDALYKTLALTDRAVATSGLQQRFFEIDGKRYSHIVDPRTGQPAAQVPSVTVIAADGATADAWATAFSVMTVEESLIDLEVLWLWGSPGHIEQAETPGFHKFVLAQ
jgi:thiamine biosynthesis lipoprotein